MKISDFISPAQVMIDVKASDKGRLLFSFNKKSRPNRPAADEVVTRDRQARGAWTPAPLETAWRLPVRAPLKSSRRHSRFFARLRHGIDFDAIDGEPVDIVVLLLIPEAGDSAERQCARLRRPCAPTRGSVTQNTAALLTARRYST